MGRRLRGLRLPALRGIINPGESWSLVVVVVVMIVVTMPPSPVLFLIVAIQFAKVAILAMIFGDPLVVIDGFVSIPAVIVVVVRVVYAIATSTTRGQGWREKSDGQQE
jgi:hypothetical protein